MKNVGTFICIFIAYSTFKQQTLTKVIQLINHYTLLPCISSLGIGNTAQNLLGIGTKICCITQHQSKVT